MLSQEEITWILANGTRQQIESLNHHLENPLWTFKPRKDNPARHDEMTSFLANTDPGLMVLLGGVGSSKTFSGAIKTAKLLLGTEAPKDLCPFWIVSQNFEMAAENCWVSNLRQFIPEDQIQSIKWLNMGKAHPATVVLEPSKNGNRWKIEFKSAQSDRAKLMGASIYGAWLDEYIPLEIVREIQTRIRVRNVDSSTPRGNYFWTLTPVIIEPEFQAIHDSPEQFNTYHWYHLNTECNDYLPEGYLDGVKAKELKERWDTITWGAFSAFAGSVYYMFNPKVHVVEPYPVNPSWHHAIGVDPGIGRGTAAVWAAKDKDNDRWIIYDEYWQEKTTYADHARAIKEKHPGFKGMIYCDPARPDVSFELLNQGLANHNAKNSVELGINEVRHYMDIDSSNRTKLHIFSHCEKLIEEIKTYKWHPTRPGDVIKENDDCADSMRYAIFSEKHYSTPAFSKGGMVKRKLSLTH